MSKTVTSNLDFGGVAKCVNLPDPVNPQDAATRAFVLAPMAAGTVKLRARGAGTGAPIDGTGAQLGAIARWTGLETFTLAGGATYTLTVAATTTWAYVNISGSGDVVIDEIAYGASAAERDGARLIIAKNTGTGRVVLRYNAAKANLITPPGNLDWVLEGALAAADIGHNGFSWCLAESLDPDASIANAKLASMAAGTVKGRALGGGTGAPQDLSGVQQGQNLRRETFVVDSTSSGSVATYAIAETTTQVVFKISGALTIHGMTASAATYGKTVEFSLHSGFAGSVTWPSESGSAGAALERVATPDSASLTITGGQVVTMTYFDSRWRVVGVAKATIVADGAATNAKLANMAAGTVKLRALGAGTGAPVDGSGEQVGGIMRLPGGNAAFGGFVAPGTYNDAAIDPEVKLVDVAPSPAGDVILTGFALSGGNGGGFFILGKFGSTGRVIVKNKTGSISANQVWTPRDVDYVMTGPNEMVAVVYLFTRWQLLTLKIDPDALAPVVANLGVPFTVRVAFSATGASGTMIDVTIWAATAPAVRILGAKLRLSAHASGSAALRSASGGGGSVVLPVVNNSAITFEFEATGVYVDAAVATATIASGGSLYLRIDRACAGEIILDCVRT